MKQLILTATDELKVHLNPGENKPTDINGY